MILDDELLKEIKKMNKLLALVLTKDLKFIDKITLLNKSNFNSVEIGEFIGVNPPTVRSELSKMRKKENGKTKPKN